jgi:hypothetical protein
MQREELLELEKANSSALGFIKKTSKRPKNEIQKINFNVKIEDNFVKLA